MSGLITITITEHLNADQDRDWLKRKVFLEPKDLRKFITAVSTVIDQAGEDDPTES